MLAHKLIDEYAIRKSRKSLSSFVRNTKSDYEFGWFNELLCLTLEEFYRDYQAGKSPRLMIFAPPRSGKTELASKRFPSWVFGKDNKTEVVACSYSSTLAERNSREVQRIIDSPEYGKIFDDTIITPEEGVKRYSKAIKTAELWELMDGKSQVSGGSYRAAGVGGGINGQGFNIGIIDDPVKNYKEASSPKKQETNAEWYETTFYTRRNPKKNGIIIIMTRWHLSDLGGWLLEQEKQGGDQWKKVMFPMEATEDETYDIGGIRYKTRKKGELLHPERMPPKFVEMSKKSGAISWSALYQQDPTIKGGNFFKGDHWQFYEMPPKFTSKIIVADTAQKTGKHNDYTVFSLWGYFENKIYLIDLARLRLDAVDLNKRGLQFWKNYGGGAKGPVVNARAMYVEDKSSGIGLIQTMRKEGVPVIPIPRDTDKVTRATNGQPYIQSGMVYLPVNAKFLNDFMMEFEEFNLNMTHAHDDQVDVTLDAIDIFLDKSNSGMNFAGMA